MADPDFQKIVIDLEGENLTHKQIADKCEGTASNISAIKNNGTVPRWPLGDKLIRLHKDLCGNKSREG